MGKKKGKREKKRMFGFFRVRKKKIRKKRKRKKVQNGKEKQICWCDDTC